MGECDQVQSDPQQAKLLAFHASNRWCKQCQAALRRHRGTALVSQRKTVSLRILGSAPAGRPMTAGFTCEAFTEWPRRSNHRKSNPQAAPFYLGMTCTMWRKIQGQNGSPAHFEQSDDPADETGTELTSALHKSITRPAPQLCRYAPVQGRVAQRHHCIQMKQ